MISRSILAPTAPGSYRSQKKRSSTPPRRIARVEGKRGAYYSKRLHHALVRFVTDNGRDEKAFEKILQQRFGVTTRITDYRELTGEPPWRFQEFHAEEIVEIINNLEEMPSGCATLPVSITS